MVEAAQIEKVREHAQPLRLMQRHACRQHSLLHRRQKSLLHNLPDKAHSLCRPFALEDPQYTNAHGEVAGWPYASAMTMGHGTACLADWRLLNPSTAAGLVISHRPATSPAS